MITKLNRQRLAFTVLALWAQDLFGTVREQTVSLTALGEPLTVRVFLPPDYTEEHPARYPSLYINDGQDAEPPA
jgi:predicted alpha/beta superfamily hydrolase